MLKKQKLPVVRSYTSNPNLKTIKPGWKGTPLDQDGLFRNHEFPWTFDYQKAAKFTFSRNPQRDEKEKDNWRITVIKDRSWLNDPSDKIVWLGHATFFVQLDGIRMLIDPVFGELPVGERYSELPVDADQFLDIDYILVSHAHYDHCDKDSIQLLDRSGGLCTGVVYGTQPPGSISFSSGLQRHEGKNFYSISLWNIRRV